MFFTSILIVDDSKTSRMITKRCFEIAGFPDSKYIEADNGTEAIALLQEHSVDLIFSDLKMPKMDGFTLIRKLQLQESTKKIPVIVVSSMGSDATEEQLKADGAIAVIKKPLNPEKILDALGAIS